MSTQKLAQKLARHSWSIDDFVLLWKDCLSSYLARQKSVKFSY